MNSLRKSFHFGTCAWEEFADQARTPLDLVSSFHHGLSREHRAADVSQLRSPWGHAG